MAEERLPQSADKYIVRFPDGMRDRLKKAAAANNRTLNAEIIRRLEQSFSLPDLSGYVLGESADGTLKSSNAVEMILDLQNIIRQASDLASSFLLFDAVGKAQSERLKNAPPEHIYDSDEQPPVENPAGGQPRP